MRRIAARQWKKGIHGWIVGVLASAGVMGVGLFWASFEKGWHVGLIASCVLLALYLIGKKAACPDESCLEVLKAAGAQEEQIRQMAIWQIGRMLLAAAPLGIALFLALKGM